MSGGAIPREGLRLTSARIIFRSAHGDRTLTCLESDSVVDICRRYGIPSSQVSTYQQSADGNLSLIVRPLDPVIRYIGDETLVVIPNRNIDYFSLIGGEHHVKVRAGASAWVNSRLDGPDGEPVLRTEYLQPSDAMTLVGRQVTEAMETCAIGDEPLVIGVSGGGDSNALLSAIVHSGLVSLENIYPVMMMGIPDWDDGLDRAQGICADVGLSLRTVSEGETARILGFEGSGADWVTAFERHFPGDDLEVLGVYAVRKVLEHVAQDTGSRRIVVGNNLEDCLADLLYFISAGMIPFPRPIGRMAAIDVFYPLWLTPKAVIDGCFPKYSLANYQARYPSRMRGRAYFYYLAQMIVDAYPGAGQDLLRGAHELSSQHFVEWPSDPEFGTPTSEDIPLEVRMRLRKLFGRSGVVR